MKPNRDDKPPPTEAPGPGVPRPPRHPWPEVTAAALVMFSVIATLAWLAWWAAHNLTPLIEDSAIPGGIIVAIVVLLASHYYGKMMRRLALIEHKLERVQETLERAIKEAK